MGDNVLKIIVGARKFRAVVRRNEFLRCKERFSCGQIPPCVLCLRNSHLLFAQRRMDDARSNLLRRNSPKRFRVNK